MKAALFVGGWEGHKPQEFCDWAVDLLEGEGFEVVNDLVERRPNIL